MKLPQIEPMTLSRVAAPFDHPDFLFELKQDGFRCVAYVAESRCDSVSSKMNRYKSLDSLKTALAKLKAKTAILDGELVCLDDEGKSRFNKLLRRRAEPAFYAFDLLWLNGKDLRQLPLIERKKRLRQLIAKSDCERIIYVQHIEMRGCVLYRAICKKDLEGYRLQAKRRRLFSFRTLVEGAESKIHAPTRVHGISGAVKPRFMLRTSSVLPSVPQ